MPLATDFRMLLQLADPYVRETAFRLRMSDVIWRSQPTYACGGAEGGGLRDKRFLYLQLISVDKPY